MSAPSAPPAAEPAPENLDWHAVLDDGRRLVVDHLVLLGRNPQPAPGEEDAELIKIADETRTVSKLHLAIGVDPAGLYVVDRGSTNGSTVTTPGGATRRACRVRWSTSARARSCRWATTGWRSAAAETSLSVERSVGRTVASAATKDR